MLNHFNHNSKGSFRSGENRFIFKQAENAETSEQIQERNVALNQSLVEFEGNLNRLRDEQTSIDYEITEEGNIFQQIESSLSETFAETEATSLAAELADALFDSDQFNDQFNSDVLINPQKTFERIKIQNGNFELTGNPSFSIPLLELQSDHYTALIEARDAAIAEAGANTEAQLDQELGELLDDDATYEGQTEGLDEAATAQEFTEEIDHETLFKIGYISNVISDNRIDITDATNINSLITNFLSSRLDFEDYLATLSAEEINTIFEEAAGLRGETIESALAEFTEDTEVDIVAAEGLRGAAIDATVNYTVETAENTATDPEAQAVLDSTLTSIGENPPISTNTEALRTFLRENLPQFALDGIHNFYRGIARTLSIFQSNQAAEEAAITPPVETPAETTPTTQAEVTPTGQTEAPTEVSQTDIELRNAMEIDATAQFEYYQASLDGAISNFENYSTFDLPENFQNNYSRNALRLLLTSGRVEEADLLISELNDLGITLDNLHRILEFRTDGDTPDGTGINTGNFLMFSPFYINRRGIRRNPDEQLRIFLEETQSLSARREELNDTERQELVARLSYYQRVDSVIGRLVNLELVEVADDELETLDTSLDNIRRVDFSRGIRRELSRRLPEEYHIGRHDNRLEKLLMAYYIYAFGPLDHLMSNEDVDISLTSFAEGRVVQNNRRQNQFILNVDSIPESHIQTIADLFINNNGVELMESELRERNLTDALNSIRRSDENYEQIREISRQFRIEEMEENPSQSQLTFHHLAQIFDLNSAGMMLRRGRGTISPIDQIGGAVPDGENIQDFLGERTSDLSMYHFIADEMGVRVDIENMNVENLTSTLNLYLNLGQATVSLVNPTLSNDNPEVLEAITSASSLTIETLNDPNYNFSQGQIDAIRYGILFEAQRNDAIARAEEAVNESGEELNNEMYMELAQYWASNREVPTEAIPILARQSYGILSTIDLTDGIENTRFGAGALINLSLGAYRNEEGEWGVGVQMPNDARSWIQFTGGNIMNESMIRTPGNFIEGFAVGVEVGHRFEGGGSLSAGGNVGAWGFNVYIGGRTREGRRGWAFEAGGGYNSVTGGFIRLGAGRSFDGVINTNLERALRNSEFGELFMENDEFSPELITSIANGQTSNERILQIANESETLNQIIEDAQIEIESNPALAGRIGDINATLEGLKINYITALATAIVNEGIRDIDAFLSTGALAFSTRPPFIIPIIGVTSGGNRRVYPGGISGSQARGRSGVLMAQQIVEAISSDGSNEVISVQLEGATITTNAEGNFAALEIFTHDSRFLEETGARIEALENLNEHTNTTGITFEELEENENYRWAFRMNQNDLDQYGLGYSTEILTDRYSGITVEYLGEGLFGVQWGSSSETPPPGDLIITREGIIDDNGYNPTINIISFSRGQYVPSDILRNGPMANSIIFIDENGRVTEEDGSHTYSRTLRLANYERPELEIADYEFSTILDEARRNKAMFTASENLLQGLEYNRGSILDVESINPEVSRFIESLLENDEFIIQLANFTTFDIDGRPDFNSVSNLINEQFQNEFSRTAEDSEMAYIISRLMPSTYLTLERIESTEERINEVVRVATEVTTQVIREVAEDIDYPGKIDRLIIAITNISEQNIRGNEALLSALSTTPISTETLTEALDNNHNIATAFTVATWANMDTRGLRQLIFDPSLTSPKIVQNSVTEFNLSNEDHAEIASFLDYLYEQPAQEIDLNNPEFVTSDEFEDIMLSRSATQLLSLVLDTNEGGQRLSLISFLIGDAEAVQYITDLREQLESGESITEIPTDNNLTAIRFLTENIMTLMGANHNTESITLTNPEDPTFSIEIPLQTNSGTMLLYPCANLSFYYDRIINEEAEILLPEDYSIISGRTTYQTLGRPGRDALSTTGSIELAMMFDIGTTGKTDTPTFQEEDVVENAEGDQYVPETDIANPPAGTPVDDQGRATEARTL